MRNVRVLIGLIFLVLSVCHAGAASKNDKEPSVSAWTSQHLNKVGALLAEDQYTKAREKLNSLLSSVKDNSFEAGLVNQAFAYSYALQENYPQAIAYFERAMPGLSASFAQTQKTRFDLGQLYMAEEHYQKAVDILKLWIKDTDKDSAQANILVGNSYAQLEQPLTAIPYVKKALALNKAAGNGPKESWYQLLLSLYYDTDNYRASVKLLPVVIELFPDRATYWKQLGSVHLQLKDFKAGAAALEIAWQNGLLTTESELLRLANLMLHNDMPDRAGRLLAQSLKDSLIESNEKHWQMLGDSWLLSREFDKAVAALSKAATFATDGNLNERIARILIDKGDWQQAKQQLYLALKKGKLKYPGNTYLLLGIAEIELDQKDQARKAFNKAIKYKKTKKSATQWLKFIDQNA